MENPVRLTAVKCEKHQGHSDFIASSELKPSHLPIRCRSLLFWALIKIKAPLTVKLTVNNVSSDRPKELQTLFSLRNSGSGHLTSFDKSHPDVAAFTVLTNFHVVFNQEEAASTTVEFWFDRHSPVFSLKNAELSDVCPKKDLSKLIFRADKDTIHFLESRNMLRSIKKTLSQNMYSSLLDTVVIKYQTLSFSWPSFLFEEINCLKNMKISTGNMSAIEIKLNISPMYSLDVILLLTALKTSNPDNFATLMENILDHKKIKKMHKVESTQKTFITLISRDININDNQPTEPSKEEISLDLEMFLTMNCESKVEINGDFIKQSKQTFPLMTLLNECPLNIDKVCKAVKEFCSFDILVRQESGSLVLEIPLRSSDECLSIKLLEVRLNGGNLQDGGASKNCIAVCISHPHGCSQHISFGTLEGINPDSELVYTTPTCPVCSGAPVYIIPMDFNSLEELESMMDLAIHSSATKSQGFGHCVKGIIPASAPEPETLDSLTISDDTYNIQRKHPVQTK